MKAVVSWSVHFCRDLGTEKLGGYMGVSLGLKLDCLKNWSLLYSTEGLVITKATTTLG